MRAHSLLLLVAVALSGCADEAPLVAPLGSTDLSCGSTCEVIVTVGPNCSFSTNGFTLHVTTGKEDELITWRIDPASSGTVAFTASGIDPKSGAWYSEFKSSNRVSATVFTWIDKNKTKNKPYGYNVFVTQDDVACPKYDPIIINN
jgi:hypothetical protein